MADVTAGAPARAYNFSLPDIFAYLQRSELVLAVGIMAILVVLILPLPTFLLEGFQEQQNVIAAQAEQNARQQATIDARLTRDIYASGAAGAGPRRDRQGHTRRTRRDRVPQRVLERDLGLDRPRHATRPTIGLLGEPNLHRRTRRHGECAAGGAGESGAGGDEGVSGG